MWPCIYVAQDPLGSYVLPIGKKIYLSEEKVIQEKVQVVHGHRLSEKNPLQTKWLMIKHNLKAFPDISPYKIVPINLPKCSVITYQTH